MIVSRKKEWCRVTGKKKPLIINCTGDMIIYNKKEENG